MYHSPHIGKRGARNTDYTVASIPLPLRGNLTSMPKPEIFHASTRSVVCPEQYFDWKTRPASKHMKVDSGTLYSRCSNLNMLRKCCEPNGNETVVGLMACYENLYRHTSSNERLGIQTRSRFPRILVNCRQPLGVRNWKDLI